MGKLIGIGGVSRSGKSSLAKQIKTHFSDKRVLILSQDKYVKEEKDIPKIRDRTDWEHPDSIDFPGILETIEENYAYDLIIVEGLLAFYYPTLNESYNLRIILKISMETFLSRRKKETRWGNEPHWYWVHVWESYLKYSKVAPDQVIPISGEVSVNKQTLEEVVKNITS